MTYELACILGSVIKIVGPKTGLINHIVHLSDSHILSVWENSDFILTPLSSRCNPGTIIPKGSGFKMANLNVTSLLKHQ